jgi:protein-tyrosine sulfotransferase
MGSAEVPLEMREAPLFVVGMWRSGTSLLYALLNQHPQIALLYESDLLTLKPVFSLGRKTGWWMPKIEAWNRALTRHQIDGQRIDPGIRDMAGAFRAVAGQYAQRKGATVWGCKSPNYYDQLPALADCFPSAKFLILWRDPADVLRSVIRAGQTDSWFARPGMELRALLGYERMARAAEELERRRASVFQLRYEDLIGDPRATMQAISDFLGLRFDPRTVSLEGSDRSAVYEGEHHAMVKSSAIRTSGERAEVLSPAMRNKLERYIAYWRRHSYPGWALKTRIRQNTRAASWLERTADHVRYSMLRSADRAIPFAFAIAPTALWQKYRRIKSRWRPPIVKPAGSSRLADLSQ